MSTRQMSTTCQAAWRAAQVLVFSLPLWLAVAESQAETRKFNVFLANPRAQWIPQDQPMGSDMSSDAGGQPADGTMMPNPGDIDKWYFDYTRNGVPPQARIDSFKEWWFEVSYGNVIIEGSDINVHTFGWFDLPWPVSPKNHLELSAEDHIDLDNAGPYTYGRGERFTDGTVMFYTDFSGQDLPLDGTTQPSIHALEDGAFTPGERFMDLDGDNRYDSLFEPYSTQDINENCICNYAGNDLDALKYGGDFTLMDLAGNPVPGSGNLEDCIEQTNELLTAECPETEAGQMACEDAGCTWDPGTLPNCPSHGDQTSCQGDEGCEWIPACTGAPQCPAKLTQTQCELDTECTWDPPAECVLDPGFVADDAECIAQECPEGGGTCLVQGCDIEDYFESGNDDERNLPEPFEDYLIFRDRAGDITNGGSPPSDNPYQPVPADYIQANYPGDWETLQTLADNNVYDSPEAWEPYTEDGGYVRGTGDFANPTNDQGNLERNLELTEFQGDIAATPQPSWYEDFWKSTFVPEGPADVPPAWPDEGLIRDLQYFPAEDVAGYTYPFEINYQSNKGGRKGYGTAGDQEAIGQPVGFSPDTFCGVADSPWQPLAEDGCGDGTWVNPEDPTDPGSPIYPTPQQNYNGPKEYYDSPSSIYHARYIPLTNEDGCPIDLEGEEICDDCIDCDAGDIAQFIPIMLDYGGDTTFGETTSSDPYFQSNRTNRGADRGTSPFTTSLEILFPDGYIVPAGPLAGGDVFFPTFEEGNPGPYGKAIPVHGCKLADGGNVMTLELMTWVRKLEDPRALPFSQDTGNVVGQSAGSMGMGFDFRTGEDAIGFADFDMDGLLDLGEGVTFGYRDTDDDGTLDSYYGVESYAVDGRIGTGGMNNGTFTDYPYNRDRMIEDIIGYIDSIHNMAGLIDSWGVSGITLLPGSMGGETGSDGTFSHEVDNSVFSVPAAGFNAMPVNDVMVQAGPYDGTVPCPDGADCTLVPTPWRLMQAYVSANSMAIALDRGHPMDVQQATEGKFKITFAAHEYGHIWEGWVDFYDYDTLPDVPSVEEAPVGGFDIMAGDRAIGLLPKVHTAAWHKQWSGWIDPVDLTTVLTPGISKEITIIGSEAPNPGAGQGSPFSPQSYYFFPNQYVGGGQLVNVERFDFWHISDTRDNIGSEPKFGNEYPWGDEEIDYGLGSEPDGIITLNRRADECDSGEDPSGDEPDGGVLIMHLDVEADSLGIPAQQIDPSHVNYLILQADGDDDLMANFAIGNGGDNGDYYPGTCNNTLWTPLSYPHTRWWAPEAGVSGIEIHNSENLGVNPNTGFGSSRVEFFWQPRDTASLTWLNVDSTVSSGSMFPLNYRAYDVAGFTRIHMFKDTDSTGFNGVAIPSCPPSPLSDTTPFLKKAPTGPGPKDVQGIFDVDLNCFDDGPAYFYAFLEPTGSEPKVSPVRPFINNVGNGNVTINPADVRLDPANVNSVKVESWTLTVVDDAIPGAEKWSVVGTRSGLQATQATTNVLYTSANPAGAIKLTIHRGSIDFKDGDYFTFTTPGWTPYSSMIQVEDHAVGPHPLADFEALDPTVGPRPLQVQFDGTLSTDPSAGLCVGDPLDYDWDFGDGGSSTQAMPTHTFDESGTYDITLVVTNCLGQTGTKVREGYVVVLSNPPTVILSTTPNPAQGALPLSVQFGVQASDPDGDAISKYEFDWQMPGTMDDFDIDDFAADFTMNTSQGAVNTTHIYSTVYNGLAAVRVTDVSGDSRTVVVEINAGNLPPNAIFSAGSRTINGNDPLPLIGTVPFTLNFNGAVSTDPDLDALTYAWFFSAAALQSGIPDATGPQATHTFSAVGTFLVTLVVTDPDGASDSASVQVQTTLGEPNVITVSIVASKSSGASPLAVNFTANATSSNGSPLDYTWSFGDGSADAFGKTVSHTFTNAGSQQIVRTVSVLVQDDAGTQKTATKQITVYPPGGSGDDDGPFDPNLIAEFFIEEGSASGNAPLAITFNTTGSEALDGTPVTCRIEFGDGSMPVNVLPGTLVPHTYHSVGTFTAYSFTVGQGGSETRSDGIAITVNDSGTPIAAIDANVLEGEAPLTISFDASGSVDPEGQALTFSWEFGNGAQGTGTTVNYTYQSAGTYVVTLSADDGGAVGTATVTIEVSSPLTPPGGGGGLGNDNTVTQPNPDDANGACGAGCGPMGAGQLLATLIGLLGVRMNFRRRRL
ncbi:MAG: hypothetical protein HJJLKODD_02271 [Phycisphaerae bacterium]|nr:hypothetical protein [Phycisphaerae bacterium]